MDDTSLTPFVNALRRVFDIAFQMNVVTTQGAGEPGAAIAPDVSAGIMLGGALQATLLLEFSLPTAQRVVSLFAGLDVHEQDESDIRDAIGEIACMVAGNAKAHFGAADLPSSIPAVTMGKGRHVHDPASGVGVTCVSDCGDFTLRLVPPQTRATITTRTLTEAISR